MTVKLVEKKIRIEELYNGYSNKGDDGVIGYSGNLDIRPPYQREFVYDDEQRDKVIDSVMNGLPLNVIYWADNGNNEYEVLDGQQRIISICEYIAGNYNIKINGNIKFFHSLTQAEKQQILDYKLLVYFCTGTDDEKQDWFETINIAGEELTKQEIRNAVYVGPFVMAAKRHFSKRTCAAYGKGGRYLNDSGDNARIRQGYLQTALNWIVKFQNLQDIEEYMSQHQHDPDAKELWDHFETVIDWIEATFPTYRSKMKGLPWGDIYNEFHNQSWNSTALEIEIQKLLDDDEVTNDKGIWQYVLSRKKSFLHLRTFEKRDKVAKWKEQNKHCAYAGDSCPSPVGTVFEIDKVHADHIVPWSGGGKTEMSNCQVLCQYCNNHKGAN